MFVPVLEEMALPNITIGIPAALVTGSGIKMSAAPIFINFFPGFFFSKTTPFNALFVSLKLGIDGLEERLRAASLTSLAFLLESSDESDNFR